MNPIKIRVLLFIVLLVGCLGTARANSTADHVKSAGILSCGVVNEPEDYTKDDTHGNMSAFGAEFCKAVAAAVLGDGTKVRLTVFPDEQHGFTAVKSGQIDLLAGATPSPVKAAIYDIQFGQPIFFDGQGLIVSKNTGIRKAADLVNKQICYIANTGAEDEVIRYFQRLSIKYKPFPFEEVGEMEAALVTGHCAAMTADISRLANARAAFHSRTKDFTILPDAITLDPLSPAYRAEDVRWARIVDWTLYALVQADIDGIGGADVEKQSVATDLQIQALLHDRTGLARTLGLNKDWAARALKAVGNYGEMFNRVLGADTPLGSVRVMNTTWNKGGLHYAPPLH